MTTWGNLDIDATEGNKGPEIITVDNPVPGQTYRVIIRFYMRIFITMTENGWETVSVSDDTPVNLRVTLDGKECLVKTLTMNQLEGSNATRADRTPFYKAVDIKYENGDCSEFQSIYGIEYNETYLFDPLDPVNPRSVWCDVETSPGCP